MLTELETDRLTGYRTQHRLRNYGEFDTLEKFIALEALRIERGLDRIILGNGSNAHFKKTEVESAVLVNKLPRDFKYELTEEGAYVSCSSSVPITYLLKFCRQNGLEGPYYLASVPATIGGAVAMNAGRGSISLLSIYDYLQSVDYFDKNVIKTVKKSEIDFGYRMTPFTGLSKPLVMGATFFFKFQEGVELEMKNRIEWSRDHQDLSTPNCGSVFSKKKSKVLQICRRQKSHGSYWSPKVKNWICCPTGDPRGVTVLIKTAQLAHQVIFQKCRVEQILVD